MTDNDFREQVAQQCDVVVHMGTVLANLFRELAIDVRQGRVSLMLHSTGKESAQIMNELGNILNDMDAVSEDDAWTTPIFDKASELWPRED